MSDLAGLGRLLRGHVAIDEPLAPKTSLRVGGQAELFYKPPDNDALVHALSLADSEEIPVWVLGGGANTLVSDAGFSGMVVKLPPDAFPEEAAPGDDGEILVTLGGGASISRLIQKMRTGHWVGAEFLAGIPGTLGGALAMNAGTKHGECISAVDSVEVATVNGVGWIRRAELQASYRNTALPKGGIVTRVRFRLREGDAEASAATMEADLAYRKSTQPLSLPNCGSVFRNPPGDFAGRLIEKVGLKGHREGQAEISRLHANWIVNLGGATAANVHSLIRLAQKRVFEETGIELVPEVKRMGSFEP